MESEGRPSLARQLTKQGLIARCDRRIDKVAPRGYFVAMHAVGLKALKNQLSKFVRLAENGETVLVTDRDRVVAEIGPPRAERSPRPADAFLAEAVRSGLITPPSMKSAAVPPRKPVAPWEDIAAGLDEDRADR